MCGTAKAILKGKFGHVNVFLKTERLKSQQAKYITLECNNRTKNISNRMKEVVNIKAKVNEVKNRQIREYH